MEEEPKFKEGTSLDSNQEIPKELAEILNFINGAAFSKEYLADDEGDTASEKKDCNCSECAYNSIDSLTWLWQLEAVHEQKKICEEVIKEYATDINILRDKLFNDATAIEKNEDEILFEDNSILKVVDGDYDSARICASMINLLNRVGLFGITPIHQKEISKICDEKWKVFKKNQFNQMK